MAECRERAALCREKSEAGANPRVRIYSHCIGMRSRPEKSGLRLTFNSVARICHVNAMSGETPELFHPPSRGYQLNWPAPTLFMTIASASPTTTICRPFFSQSAILDRTHATPKGPSARWSTEVCHFGPLCEGRRQQSANPNDPRVSTLSLHRRHLKRIPSGNDFIMGRG